VFIQQVVVPLLKLNYIWLNWC